MLRSPRMSVLAAVAQLALMAAAAAEARSAAHDRFPPEKLKWWEVAGPVWEADPGVNLYWHDPDFGWTEKCRNWPPEVLGCAPLWYAKSELLVLTRDVNRDFAFASQGLRGPVALSTTGFDDGFEAGARTMFGCSLDHWYRLEGAYFGAQSWSDAAAIYDRAINSQGGVGNLFSPFTNFGAAGAAVGLDYNNFTSIRFYSELHNAELNLRRRLLMRPGRYESSVIAGARYLNIEERFAYFAQSATPGPASSSNAVDVSADNEMIGVQLGLTGQFLVRPRYWIDCDVRGGVFHNDASQATLLTRTDNTGAVTPYSGAAQRDRSAFVGDLSLQMNCQFTRSLTLCAGYNAVWVTGVALGANNFNPDINVLTLGPATLDHKGVAVYHGPNIGLVLAR